MDGDRDIHHRSLNGDAFHGDQKVSVLRFLLTFSTGKRYLKIILAFIKNSTTRYDRSEAEPATPTYLCYKGKISWSSSHKLFRLKTDTKVSAIITDCNARVNSTNEASRRFTKRLFVKIIPYHVQAWLLMPSKRSRNDMKFTEGNVYM